MNTFRSEIHDAVARQIARAPTARLLSLVEALCDERPRIEAAPTAIATTRYTNLDEHGKPVAIGEGWTFTRDVQTNLIWLAVPLDCGEVSQPKACEAASALRLLGSDKWQLSSVQETLSIIEYERCEPAVDPAHFKGPYGYTWTRTLAAKDKNGSPAGFAWFVDLGLGGAYRNPRSHHFLARAVLAGQQLGFGI